jgi:hypothetical protein
MNRLLVGLAVATMLLGGPPQAKADPIAYWRFEEGAGTTFSDSSGNGHTGTLSGGATFSTLVPVNPIPQTGATNSFSLLLNGRNGFGMVSDSPSLHPANAITLEAWFRLTSNSSTALLFGRQFNAGTANSYQLGLRPDLFFGLTNSSGVSQTIDTSFFPSLFQWYFVAGTWDGSTMRLFVDGAEIGSLPFTGPIGYFRTNPVLIGADDDGAGVFGFFPGNLDEIRISDTALSPSQFLNAPAPAPVPVPEPSSLTLLGLAIFCLLGCGWRQRWPFVKVPG